MQQLAAQQIDNDRTASSEEFQEELEKSIDSIFLYSSLVFNPKQSLYLGEYDFRRVAKRLGVEVAAIKAVVETEAGRSLAGLTAEGEPVVNYSANTFLRRAAKRGINIHRARKEHPAAFSPRQKSASANYERLREAMAVDTVAAVESTYWGMFQIGGFNYKLCGTGSHTEFAELMSRSERDQLELFAEFLTNCGMLDAIRNKDWNKFARMYNGPSYYRRGYHNKLASAYARYKREE